MKLDWLLLCYLSVFVIIKKWLYLIINLIIIIIIIIIIRRRRRRRRRRRTVFIFGIVPLFFYILNFYWLIMIFCDLLWHLIRLALCIPLQSLLCAIPSYLHDTSWISWNYFFKSTENLVKKYYFCLIDKRKRHKQIVCLGVCQLWKMLHWFFVQHRLCNLHFAWLCLIDKCVLLIFILLSFHCRRKRAT